MAELKTKPTDESVATLLEQIGDEGRRQDCLGLIELMREVTGEEPSLWGSMVGFGRYHYRYASGHEGDSFLVGFSPRKRNLSIYLSCDFNTQNELMAKLGKHKTGKACLYVNRLDDVDCKVLRTLVERSVEQVRQRHS